MKSCLEKNKITNNTMNFLCKCKGSELFSSKHNLTQPQIVYIILKNINEID